MRRESHRYRGVRRSSRGAGWGHRAVYVASAIAAASLVAGFGLAGYWFGTFSHTWNQATATGFESAPYGVKFLSAGATEAVFAGFNYSGILPNSTSGPCSALPTNGTNVLNQTGAGAAFNLSAANSTVSSNSSYTIICLNSVFNGTISYLWQNYSGYDPLNQSSWDNITGAANGSQAPPSFVLPENYTGVNTSTVVNMTGCNPVWNGNNLSQAAFLANCPFFAGNDNTTYVPHDGFYASNGTWISTANQTYWHPEQYGYLASDTIFYATIEFVTPVPNVTYEAAVSFAGATPIPQVFFLNTGAGGANERVTFVFDMTAAWFTALPGTDYGLNDGNVSSNSTGGFGSFVFTAINTFSITVSQCYVDGSGMVACPDTLGGVGFP